MKKYDIDFYQSVSLRAQKAAQVAADQIYKFYKPQSLIDVGCGQGIWSRAFLERISTLEKVSAVDLSSSNITYLKDENINASVSIALHGQDLNLNPSLPGSYFDFAICVEVLEHISKQSSEMIIAELGEKCGMVLFSAAISGQGGTHHINEQSLSYWNQKMGESGFVALDVIRPIFILDREIPSYYTNSIAIWLNKAFVSEIQNKIDWVELSKILPSELMDRRKTLTKLRFRILSLMPRQFVTFLAILKNRLLH